MKNALDYALNGYCNLKRRNKFIENSSLSSIIKERAQIYDVFAGRHKKYYYQTIKQNCSSSQVHQSGSRNTAFFLPRVTTTITAHQLWQSLFTLLLSQHLRTVSFSLRTHQLRLILILAGRQLPIQLTVYSRLRHPNSLEQNVLFVQKVTVGLIELLVREQVQSFSNQMVVEQPLSAGPVPSIHCQAEPDEVLQVFRVVLGNSIIDSS